MSEGFCAYLYSCTGALEQANALAREAASSNQPCACDLGGLGLGDSGSGGGGLVAKAGGGGGVDVQWW